ncbi:epoxide hydrolase 1 [Lasiosphaeria miniovina]|uniref:Epoxide hydrolase 1 n=1 Tax=Lasiosphaeria miniovina TaxID=1954250 RepID=A0AA40DLA7_9PEZI|nr:epoxide hydrolase 1 [Lasiosphaeria miniovina]KAK0704028.1 epoxide hydrolase 1 [Lasiosphaeria miniovina]
MTSKSYSTLPGTADKDAVRPFAVDIADTEVERMLALVKLSNVASACYENSLPDGSRRLGLGRDWLVEAKRVWETDFDWKSLEKHMNSFPHFRADVPIAGSQSTTSLKVHFVALFSEQPTATPIVLLHGWPGSFLEFLPMLALLRDKYPDPAQLPYHVIVPSLPGYALSDAFPADRDYGIEDTARVLDALVAQRLGLPGYVVQGGDIGSRVGRIMAAQYPGCIGTLLNYCPLPPPAGAATGGLTETEQRGLERTAWFKSEGSAYGMIQATRPGTLGLVLSSSPLALLAWVGEKFLDWVDPASFPPDASMAGSSGGSDNKSATSYSTRLMHEVLASVSLYWLTGRAHTCMYSYRETFSMRGDPLWSHALPAYHIREPKKLGFSYFPLDIAPTPREWIAATGNLVFWRSHDVGGHFAALEQPAALLANLEEFVGSFSAVS